jgi:alpha-beta hydrolase superfamily lysophospholipase
MSSVEIAMSAHLVEIAEAPIPPRAEVAWLVRPDGRRLRVALFAAEGTARGSVVLSGGRNEPIEKYFEVIGELQARGFTVLAHDWRGQGLSDRALADRLRGHCDSHEQMVADFVALLDGYQARLPSPRIAIGHSMGGCLTLRALVEGEAASGRLAGALLSAPMLSLVTRPLPPPIARLAARLTRLAGRADRYGPAGRGRPFDLPFEGNVLTQDRARFARHRAQVAACPDLALGGPTWGWLDAAFRGMAVLARPDRLRRVAIPVVICSAQRDRLVDAAAHRRAVHLLPRGRLVEVPGAFHEILMETDERRAFFWWAFDDLVRELTP